MLNVIFFHTCFPYIISVLKVSDMACFKPQSLMLCSDKKLVEMQHKCHYFNMRMQRNATKCNVTHRNVTKCNETQRNATFVSETDDNCCGKWNMVDLQ